MTDDVPQPEKKADAPIETAENPDFTRAHPLERRWTLWYDNKGKKSKEEWAASLKPICTVSTVEEFWCLFNNILSPAQLEERTDIYFFLDGVKPDWDEAETKAGGLWTIQVKGRGPSGKESLDSMWADLVLHLIGEQFEHGDDICGIACSIRKQDRVAVWTKTAANEAVQTSIGRQLKELLGVPKSQSIGFVSHSDAKEQDKAGSKAKVDTYSV